MKTANELTRMFRGSGLGLAVIVVATFTANAQYKATGGDGIAASPRLRQQLNDRAAQSTFIVAVAPAMSCPKCTDAWVAQADTSPKGSGARTLTGQTTKLVAKHLCEGCGAEWSVAGTGKGTKTVAAHKCSSCGAENLACCGAKGAGDAATKGMTQKPEIAPVK
jgi:hypothetical protein